MSKTLVAAAAVLSFLLSGCNCGPVIGGGGDGGPPDAGPGDAGPGELEGVGIDEQGNVVVFWLDGGSRLVASWADAGAAGNFMGPRWQPNGSTIAFADGQKAWLAQSDGGLRQLDTPVTASSVFQGLVDRVEWSPDGTRLAVGGLELVTDNDGVFLLPPDGGLDPELIGVADEWGWEPDGSGVLYSSYVNAVASYRTWSKSAPGATETLRAQGRFLDVSAGGVLAYQVQRRYPDGGYGFSQLALARDGGTMNVLPDDTLAVNSLREGARWSPNGAELAIEGEVIRGIMPVAYQAVVASGGAVRHTVYDQPNFTQTTPQCLRYAPNGRLSFVVSDGTSGSLQFLEGDGGVRQAPARPLSPAVPRGCLDWRFRR